MAIEREKGYEYRGWKLGENVRVKFNSKKCKIIGFCENDSPTNSNFIAIDGYDNGLLISETSYVSSRLKGVDTFFRWVTEYDIQKIEDDVKKKNEEVMKKINQYETEKLEVEIKDRFRERSEDMQKLNDELISKVKDKNEYNQCKHYSNTGIEPIEFITANKYGFSQGNIVKYNHRIGKKKGQEANDIIKIVDYAMLLAWEKGIEVKEDDLIELIKYRSQWIKERRNER